MSRYLTSFISVMAASFALQLNSATVQGQTWSSTGPSPSLGPWLLALALTGLVIYGSTGLARSVWRLGFDPSRRLQMGLRWLKLLTGVAWLVFSLGQFAQFVPTLSPAMTLVLGLSVVIVFARPAQNLWAGLMLSLQGRVQAGDKVQVAGVSGTVVSVGLTQARIRQKEGAIAFLPTRLLTESALILTEPTTYVAVQGRAPLRRPPAPSALEQARQELQLSPWRVAGTPVRVWVENDCMVAHFETWGTPAVAPARVALEALLQSAVESGHEA